MKRGIAVLLAVVSIFVLTTTGLAGGLEGSVTASTLYVREQPFSESNTIHFVRNGEKVTILQKVNEWYHVTCANGISGYVYAQFISIERTDSSSNFNSHASANGTNVPSGSKAGSSSTALQTEDGSKATTVSTTSLPAITRMGHRGDGVTTIQQALADQGYNPGKIDGIFGPVTLQAVRDFQKENGLVVDGIVGKATLRVLFGDVQEIPQGSSSLGGQSTQGTGKGSTSGGSQLANGKQQPADDKLLGSTPVATSPPPASLVSSSKTKLLDWFADGYSLINKNKNITIYDLNTGVVWQAKYINGKNHADIVPASPADAKKIASGNIVGSYVRRPVVVTIAGSNYAGSMYAVGHGETNYVDYFKGVMCVHFTGSQTHGTQKVDADHQRAIQVALKATVS